MRITLKRAYSDGTVAVDLDPLSLGRAEPLGARGSPCSLVTAEPPGGPTRRDRADRLSGGIMVIGRGWIVVTWLAASLAVGCSSSGASGGSGSGSGSGQRKAFGACCQAGTECSSGVCNADHAACSVDCTKDDDCPPEPKSGKSSCDTKRGVCQAESSPSCASAAAQTPSATDCSTAYFSEDKLGCNLASYSKGKDAYVAHCQDVYSSAKVDCVNAAGSCVDLDVCHDDTKYPDTH